MRTTKKERQEMLARCEAVPKGPWTWDLHEGSPCLLGRVYGVSVILMPDIEFEDDPPEIMPDYSVNLLLRDGPDLVELQRDNPIAQFIAHARTDLPDVLADFDDLEAAKATVEAEAAAMREDDCKAMCCHCRAGYAVTEDRPGHWIHVQRQRVCHASRIRRIAGEDER